MTGARDPVLTFTPRGIYCPAADAHIDPWRPVERALITHAHADHARPGHGAYLCTPLTAPVLRHRLGDVAIETLPYGDVVQMGGARISFHPAGHVPGSAQIRVEVRGEVWVVSGDYKTAPDGLSDPFEPVACHAFISECTFGLPVFAWAPQDQVMGQINRWWADCAAAGKTAVIGAYSLGKAQRILANVDPSIGPILTHGAVEGTNRVLRAAGVSLPETVQAGADISARTHPGALLIVPPAALEASALKRFGPVDTAAASGWMRMRGVRRRRGVARGFVLSDHADWPGLNAAIAAIGAERIFVTHGYTEIFRRWLADQGHDAAVVATEFTGESLDAATGPEPDQERGPEPDLAAQAVTT